jgi:plastocyanin
MKQFSIISAITLAVSLSAAVAGDITGTVTLKGTPPPEKDITPLKDDATCGKFYSSMPTTKFYVVGANGGLADTIVMLKRAPSSMAAADATPAVIDQKGCLYNPQIFAVQAGQKITVKNSDPVMHNIHAQPAVAGNDERNEAQLPNGPDKTFVFNKPENFLRFKCDVHTWMFAWVTVVDNPYFAVTDKDGKFTIKNVPAGKYKIVALHRKAAATGVEQDIEVKADGAKADFTLDAK